MDEETKKIIGELVEVLTDYFMEHGREIYERVCAADYVNDRIDLIAENFIEGYEKRKL